MLPDLWRMAHRHVRPAPGAIEAGASGRVAEVLAGVAHHGRADAAFHASEVFAGGEKQMARALAELTGVRAPRLGLFAHIAWELCLDGALVRREGEALSIEVREGIARAVEPTETPGGEPAVDAAARLHHQARKRAAEPLPEGFDARVARMLVELGRGRWMEGYARGDVVAERIDGIRERLGFARLDGTQQAVLAAAMDEAIDRAASAIGPLLELPI
jgi:hypothetical protein